MRALYVSKTPDFQKSNSTLNLRKHKSKGQFCETGMSPYDTWMNIRRRYDTSAVTVGKDLRVRRQSDAEYNKERKLSQSSWSLKDLDENAWSKRTGQSFPTLT